MRPTSAKYPPSLPFIATILTVATAALVSTTGCAKNSSGPSGGIGSSAGSTPRKPKAAVLKSYAEITNSLFLSPPENLHAAPTLVPIEIPQFPGSHSIWGATGRDNRGHVWFGVSATGVGIPSAHLFELVPETCEVIDRGDVVSQLKRCGVYRAGEGQMKIHSKIIQAGDGYLYFASMDEQGEEETGGQLPTWGSHLWRLRLPDNEWEHLMSAPEGLIAVGGAGRFIYALGYFQHVLYQLDCETATVRPVRVGSVDGHISRNFLVDHRGHAFVPRMRRLPDDDKSIVTTLVEFDTELHEIGESPLEHYLEGSPTECHGIVAYQHLADHSIVFTTHVGRLYRVFPHEDAPADVADLGWLHSRGSTYASSLFTYDGVRYVMSATCLGDNKTEWVVYDLDNRSSVATPLEVTIPGVDLNVAHALYGSSTRDNDGNFYWVGFCSYNDGGFPLLYQLRPHGAGELGARTSDTPREW